MTLNGTYGFVYSGASGIGIGAFTVHDGELVGADYAGGRYAGRVTETGEGGRISVNWTLRITPGTSLVDGTANTDGQQSFDLTHEFPPNFGDGEPEKLALESGLVTLMIKRIPDIFSPAAERGFTLQVTNPTSEMTSPNPEATIASEAAKEIGRFVVVWGSLEHEFEAAITTLLYMAPVLRPCLTTNLAFHAKTQIAEQTVSILKGHLIDETVSNELHQIIKGARSCNEDYRNFIFHWIVVQKEVGKAVLAARLKGGKSPRSIMLEVNETYFSDITQKVAALRNRLRDVNRMLYKAVAPLRSWNIGQIPTSVLEMGLRDRKTSSSGQPTDRDL